MEPVKQPTDTPIVKSAVIDADLTGANENSPVQLQANRQATPRNSFTELIATKQAGPGNYLNCSRRRCGPWRVPCPGTWSRQNLSCRVSSGFAWNCAACVFARTDCNRGAYRWSISAWRSDLVCIAVHRAGAALSLAGSGLRCPDRRPRRGSLGAALSRQRRALKSSSPPSCGSFSRFGPRSSSSSPPPCHDHSHDHGHTHNHHDLNRQVSLRELLTLGISGGIVPCPAALVVLLSAVSMQRIGFGLLLIVAFSVGLAAVLITIGLLMVYARQFMSRFEVNSRLTTRWLPLTSSAFILVFGIALAVQALQTRGFFLRSLADMAMS